MYQMEIERVRFLICNYLKIRLKKIETLKEYLLSHHDMMLRLSTNERYFLSKLQNVDQQYIEETITKRLIPEEHHDIFLNNIANLTFSSPKFDVSLSPSISFSFSFRSLILYLLFLFRHLSFARR